MRMNGTIGRIYIDMIDKAKMSNSDASVMLQW